MKTMEYQNPRSLAYRVALRFGRIFLAGGISAMASIVVAGLSLQEVQTYLLALAIAFVGGGIAALDKAVRG